MGNIHNFILKTEAVNSSIYLHKIISSTYAYMIDNETRIIEPSNLYSISDNFNVPLEVFVLKNKQSFINYLNEVKSDKNHNHIENMLKNLWNDSENDNIFYFPKYIHDKRLKNITTINHPSIIPYIYHVMLFEKEYLTKLPLNVIMNANPDERLFDILMNENLIEIPENAITRQYY